MTCSRNTVSLANFFIDLLKTLIYARPEEAFRYLKLTAEMDDTAEINAHVR